MSAEWVLPMPWPRPPLSQNDRSHWRAQHRVKQQIASDVTTIARFVKAPRGLDRVEVVLHWQPRLARKRDTDNPAPTLKAAIDALTAYGLVPDDNSAHVQSRTVVEPLGASDRVWITIRDLDAEDAA